jgi:hypothetical protein
VAIANAVVAALVYVAAASLMLTLKIRDPLQLFSGVKSG